MTLLRLLSELKTCDRKLSVEIVSLRFYSENQDYKFNQKTAAHFPLYGQLGS